MSKPMKLHPNARLFCPGCPSSLKLTSTPQITVPQIENQKDDTATTTIVGKPQKKSNAIALF